LAALPTSKAKIVFLEVDRHDEATSLVATESLVPDALNDIDFAADADGVEEEIQQLDDETVLEVAPSKIMRCHKVFGALVGERKEDGTINEDGPFDIFTSEAPEPPWVVQRTTAENLTVGMEKNSTFRPQSVHGFHYKARAPISDRHAAQALADRTVTERRGAEWTHCPWHCEVHMSTGALGKSLCLIPDAITGLIRLSLCLRCGGWMRLFRRCLYKVISSTIKIYEGVSTPAAKHYRRMCTSVFMGRGRRKRLPVWV